MRAADRASTCNLSGVEIPVEIWLKGATFQVFLRTWRCMMIFL